jgi:hypothetical protein
MYYHSKFPQHRNIHHHSNRNMQYPVHSTKDHHYNNYLFEYNTLDLHRHNTDLLVGCLVLHHNERKHLNLDMVRNNHLLHNNNHSGNNPEFLHRNNTLQDTLGNHTHHTMSYLDNYNRNKVGNRRRVPHLHSKVVHHHKFPEYTEHLHPTKHHPITNILVLQSLPGDIRIRYNNRRGHNHNLLVQEDPSDRLHHFDRLPPQVLLVLQ